MTYGGTIDQPTTTDLRTATDPEIQSDWEANHVCPYKHRCHGSSHGSDVGLLHNNDGCS